LEGVTTLIFAFLALTHFFGIIKDDDTKTNGGLDGTSCDGLS
jgi:hypothetical protein